MIVDMFLIVIQGVLSFLLSPLNVIKISIDFLASIPITENFLRVAYYLLPLDNLIPLIILTISLFVFRLFIAGIKAVEDLIPFV